MTRVFISDFWSNIAHKTVLRSNNARWARVAGSMRAGLEPMSLKSSALAPATWEAPADSGPGIRTCVALLRNPGSYPIQVVPVVKKSACQCRRYETLV